MLGTSPSLESLIAEFSRLPGIGRKTAYRMAMHIVKRPEDEVRRMAQALLDVKQHIITCSRCHTITEADPCPICSNAKRNPTVICVVEEAHDVFAIERTNEYHGVYHVLGGHFSPLDGIGPEDLRIRELVDRVQHDVQEVILAMNPNVEGEATTLYIARLLQPFPVTLTRIARGIPIGSDLEYADTATLSRALEGRIRLS